MIYAKEGEICWLPSEYSYRDLGELPQGVSLHLKNDKIGILFDGVVGSFSISKKESISVSSKFGTANFLAMLFIAEGNQRQLQNISQEFAKYGLGEDSAITNHLIRNFFFLVDSVLTTGLRQERSPTLISDTSVRGRIDYLKTVMNIASGHSNPVVQRIQTRNFDVPENRIVLQALKFVQAQVSTDQVDISLKLTQAWASRSAASTLLNSDIAHVKKKLSDNKFRGVRSFYEELIGLSLVLISQKGITLDNSANISGDSLLISTANVFEKYLRKVITEMRNPFGDLVTGPDKMRMYLYDDASFSINPDIILWKNGEPALLIDAKYKEPTSGDHYQMLSYLQRFNLSKGYLIAPTTNKPYAHLYSQAGEPKVIELRINISNIEDVPEQIRRLSITDI